MNRRSWLLMLIFLVPLAALIAWWFYTFKPVTKEVDLPMRGEARYNPLFALKLSLEAHGIEVASEGDAGFDIDALGTSDTLLLYSDIRTLSYDDSVALLAWVERGGHLIFAVPAGSEGDNAELLDALGLYSLDDFSCLNWTAVKTKKDGKEDDDPQSQHCFAHRFNAEEDLSETFEWLWGNEDDGYLFGRQYWGEGSVFIAGELDFLINNDLEEPGHAALTWQVLAPALGEGKVHLVYTTDMPPWYVSVVRHGWPILLPLLIALFAWMWARSQRFGPLLPLASAHRRALLEHIQASGEFAYHRGRAMALYAAAHRLFIERLRRRDPAMAALEGEALVQALSARFQYAAAAIRQALNPSDLAKPEQFVATIRTLMQLREKL